MSCLLLKALNPESPPFSLHLPKLLSKLQNLSYVWLGLWAGLWPGDCSWIRAHLSPFQENVKDKLRAIVVTLSYSLQTPQLQRQAPDQRLPPVAPILNAYQPSTQRAEVSMGSGSA